MEPLNEEVFVLPDYPDGDERLTYESLAAATNIFVSSSNKALKKMRSEAIKRIAERKAELLALALALPDVAAYQEAFSLDLKASWYPQGSYDIEEQYRILLAHMRFGATCLLTPAGYGDTGNAWGVAAPTGIPTDSYDSFESVSDHLAIVVANYVHEHEERIELDENFYAQYDALLVAVLNLARKIRSKTPCVATLDQGNYGTLLSGRAIPRTSVLC